MRKNHNVQPSRANGVRKQGNNPPLAKLPANNVGTFPVKLGTSHNSAFGSNTGPSKGTNGVTQSKGSKANMPANNVTDKAVTLGHTKHGVGQVPSYLKNN
jgi:hypothetical protein